jgi:hypothetical protein
VAWSDEKGVYTGDQMLQGYDFAIFATFLHLPPHLFGLCRRSVSSAWCVQGSMAGREKSFTMQSLQQGRI